MTAAFSPPSRQRGALLLADISGYTGFLEGIAAAHAELNVDTDSGLSQLGPDDDGG